MGEDASAAEENELIRLAAKEDASRLAELLIFTKRVAYRHIFQNDRVSFGEMQVLPLALTYIEKPQLLENVYVFEEEVIQGMMKLSYDENTRSFEINQLYVEPFFQNHHIGSHLVRYAEELASSRGFTTIVLWVLEKNQTARSFYEKHGFTATTENKFEDGTTEILLKYQKNWKFPV